MKTRISAFWLLALIVASTPAATPLAAAPLNTGFTYQGQLKVDGVPADGPYDFEFRLFDLAAGGVQQGNMVPKNDVLVENGLLKVDLEFGNVFDGNRRWLDVRVRDGASTGAFSPLTTRQELTAAPYALFALSGPGGSGPWQASGANIFNTNAGNVGVGTTTPLHRLALSGGPAWTLHSWGGLLALDNASAIGWRANASGTRFGMGHTTDGFFLFRTASELGTTTAAPIYDFKIDNGGNIGIGGIALDTDLSQARLNILNLSLGYGFLNTLGAVSVGSYVDGTAGGYGTRSNHPLHFFTNNSGSPQMTLATNGNVGIGTVSPSQLVHINNGSGNAAALVQTPTDAFAQYQLKSGSANTWTVGTQDNFAGGSLLFRNGASDLMAIQPNGSVTQPRDQGGFVKAMAKVNADFTIAQQYSASGGTISAMDNPNTSGTSYLVTFPFQVNDRYISVQPFLNSSVGAVSANIQTNCLGCGPNTIQVVIYDADTDSGLGVANEFFIFVY